MCILILSDEPNGQQELVRDLKEDGFDVTLATTIKEAMRLSELGTIDLFMADLNFSSPFFEYSEQFRQAHPTTPLLVLSTNADDELAIRCLLAGATDFLRKPFGKRELLFRIRRHLGVSGRIVVGNLTIHPENRRIIYCNREIRLSPTEFSILKYLAVHLDQVVDRNTLLSRFQNATDIFEKSLNTRVSRLRSKLRVAGVDEVRIVSAYGLGYRMMRVK